MRDGRKRAAVGSDTSLEAWSFKINYTIKKRDGYVLLYRAQGKGRQSTQQRLSMVPEEVWATRMGQYRFLQGAQAELL